MGHCVIKTPDELAGLTRLLGTLDLPLSVEWRKGLPSRTTQQNATLHMWFGEIAKQQADLDATEVKGMCHRRWGLPIKLRSAQFAWVWERSGAKMPYEKQCALLASGILAVSSTMNTAELSEYMDAMSRHFRSDGMVLTDPEARRYEGEMR